ncbi:MAG TPA: heme exporter protein CcmB [Bacteroidia bacterium]|jgi:heme exporter protein B
MLGRQILFLIEKELRSEWKQKYAFGGMLLYVVSTVFICRQCFDTIKDPLTWGALYWIILLFAAVNAAGRSFIQESKGRLLYLYTLASPEAVILSRTVYNIILMAVLSLICFGFYAILLGDPVQNTGLFLVTIIFGSMGLSCTLTMVSAIASKTNNNFTLLAILGFPIMLPLLVTLIKLTMNAISNPDWLINIKYVGALLGLNLIVVTLSWLLFPYLWRD